MSLLDEVLDAHGGLARWRQFSEVTATIVTGGEFWGLKGLVQDPNPRRMTVSLVREEASLHPFGAPDQRTHFTPERIAIEKLDGTVVASRDNPRESFEGHELTTPWDPLHRAYFNGYALWTYLTTPFLLAGEGFSVVEAEPVWEGGERWEVLEATFPESVASHSRVQRFYFGPDFLVRRHDYHVDIAGGLPGVQYTDDHERFAGLSFPTRRRAYRGETVMVAIDLSEISLR
ncbi:hypothetical protein VSH64_26870 [Amycolatopsis rhabdoformis]|uniref:Uncharacterized protein n=1 Tax=Amycolatopsis rhabdoformis TaxID=1448059 RepID=A0ABZ1HW94_9PSEU|nr:hypothetical protein [Amycolatopsis rhabdoformis]WSE26502.1 hypothetical protein VSH64_26870 [Amycolatopsis rhabdoformis]